MEKIVFLDRETIAPQINVSRPEIDHEWVQYGKTATDQVVQRLVGSTIAITNKVSLREEALKQLPDLKMIAIAATGYDCVDVCYCQKQGITVSNVRGYAVNTVPEHTLSLILALRRNLMGFHQDVATGVWEKSDQFCFFSYPIRDLAESNLVIVGSGSIGQSVANLARAFGMNVYFAERKGNEKVRPGYTAWEECLELADVISLHCPLNEQTRSMIGLKEFQQMKRKPLLINVARGGIVAEGAFVQAMQKGLLSGAGFDVAEYEPLRKDSPLKLLLDQPNFILTPHVAWASNEAMHTLWNQVIENIENFKKGTPSNVL